MNKNFVVIGASRGIGLELVKQYASDVNNTVWAFSRFSNGNNPFSGLKNVHTKTIDLSSPLIGSQIKESCSEITNIDILINNAGFLVNKPFSTLTYEDILTSYQTNIIGIMLATQEIIQKASPTGMHIVNISSMGGFQGTVKFPGLAAYSSSKAALVNFTELFAEEYKETSIKMNCLCLGAVQTEMLEQAFPGYVAPTSPSDMASYIVDFSFNGSKYFNGKILPVSSTTP
jgi:short-subunit dehydrogenase